MSDLVKDYIASIVALCPELSEEEIAYLASGISIAKYKAKDYYLQQGDTTDTVGYICEGLMRVFCYNSMGEEVTINFLPEESFVLGSTSLAKDVPTLFYLQCIEPTTVIHINKSHISDLRRKNLSFEHYVTGQYELAVQNLVNRTLNHLLDNAESRYLKFLEEHPELSTRIAVSHLCTYLGIKRQHLTRIRKKLLYL